MAWHLPAGPEHSCCCNNPPAISPAPARPLPGLALTPRPDNQQTAPTAPCCSQIADMHKKRGAHASCAGPGGLLYVVGGYDVSNPQNEYMADGESAQLCTARKACTACTACMGVVKRQMVVEG